LKSISSVKSFFHGCLTNLSGDVRLNEKIIVIESDDWGAIRTPSKEVLRTFAKKGFDLEKSIYKVDALESGTDLENLFDLLLSVRNCYGETPIITTNSIMANPDFERIKESDFKTYHYELFTETYKKYPNHSSNLQLLKEGIQNKLITPQFHGREHLDVVRWLKALNQGDENVHFSFSLGSTYSGLGDYAFMEAFDWSSRNELSIQKEIITDGLRIFNDVFGYHSKSFIAPCYCWDSEIESTLENSGVRIIQGQRFQLSPTGSLNKYNLVSHYFGQRITKSLTCNVRNVFFEPVNNPKIDWTDQAMAGIQSAFLMKRPAVISSHRVNYIGSIDEMNASNGLKQLHNLLNKIIRKWPDVRFVGTNQLENYFCNE
jgi:hypothetical protein